MLTKDGSESISFDALSLEATSLCQQKSFMSLFQPSVQESPNRVVKIESPIFTTLEAQPKNQPPPNPKRVKKTWKQQEQLEYFCAVIIFSFNNPYLTLSWEWWKPKRFYNFLQTHMQSVFGAGCYRNNHQCKTKDQNFKLQHYEQTDNPIDLVDLALTRIVRYVNNKKRIQKRNPSSLDPITLDRFYRFEDALIKYKSFVAGLSKPSVYQMELQNLMAYSQSLHSRTVQLWKKAI